MVHDEPGAVRVQRFHTDAHHLGQQRWDLGRREATRCVPWHHIEDGARFDLVGRDLFRPRLPLLLQIRLFFSAPMYSTTNTTNDHGLGRSKNCLMRPKLKHSSY